MRRSPCASEIDDPAAIGSVTIHTFAAADGLSRRHPETTEDMQYSLVWPVATALVRGAFGVDEVLAGFDDPRVARIVDRVRVEVDPGFSDAFPARRLARVELELDDGRLLRSGAVEAGGEPASSRLGADRAREGARGCSGRAARVRTDRVAGLGRDELSALLAVRALTLSCERGRSR